VLPSPLLNVRLPEIEMTSVAPPAGGRGGHQKGRRTSWVDAPIELPVDAAPRPRRFARFARPLLTASTMVAVAAMAVVTSVPANAFLGDAPAAGMHAAVTQPAQELGTTTAAAASITRDAYTVTDAPVVVVSPPTATSPGITVRATGSGTVRWPFDGGVRISDGFGPRVSPCAGCSSFHLGTDFLPGEGNPVYAIADGVVKSVATTGGLGVHVVIDHVINGQLIETTSAHMRTGSVRVSVGQTVHAGDVVGLVGNTGDSTGPHLHFELRLDGVTPVDSNAWLAQHAL
jgi:murein DD-endopeptidase MepM/ murein hydrolase activator NlpD